jgi:hypothetical protein
MNRNEDVLHEHRSDIHLVSIPLFLCFPEVPMSRTVTHMLALCKEGLHLKYSSKPHTTLLLWSVYISLSLSVLLLCQILYKVTGK